MTPDELKSMPKGHFVVMKTGTHPMRTRLQLFLDWGITFERSYSVSEKAQRKVAYADKSELEQNIIRRHLACIDEDYAASDVFSAKGGLLHSPMIESRDSNKSHQRQIRT